MTIILCAYSLGCALMLWLTRELEDDFGKDPSATLSCMLVSLLWPLALLIVLLVKARLIRGPKGTP